MNQQTRIIARCGLNCMVCPAWAATHRDDREARRRIAAEWSTTEYPLTANTVACDGCGTGGRMMGFCDACDVLRCTTERGLANCAACPDYGCDKLKRVWGGVDGKEAKATLDAMRPGRP